MGRNTGCLCVLVMGLRPFLIMVICGAKSCLPGFYVRCGKDREAHCSYGERFSSSNCCWIACDKAVDPVGC